MVLGKLAKKYGRKSSYNSHHKYITYDVKSSIFLMKQIIKTKNKRNRDNS